MNCDLTMDVPCYGCRINSKNPNLHSQPGGCTHRALKRTEACLDGDPRWPTRDELEELTHPNIDSVANWIKRLESTKYCPILISTQEITVKEKVLLVFTLYYPGFFPNDYQSFYSVACVNSYLDNHHGQLPAWAKLTKGTSQNSAYHGRFLKLTPEEVEAFLPKITMAPSIIQTT